MTKNDFVSCKSWGAGDKSINQQNNQQNLLNKSVTAAQLHSGFKILLQAKYTRTFSAIHAALLKSYIFKMSAITF